jgi:Icc-related predicted phosphoesterase
MHISSVSDLHLEFETTELPGGDVLILAGDTLRVAPFREWRNDADSRKERKRYEKFAKTELSKYKKVFAVLGNHEFYGDILEDGGDLYAEFMHEHAPNVTVLDNSWEIYEGIAFVGSTLWATYGAGTPEAVHILRNMNDFFRIHTNRELDSPDGFFMTVTPRYGRQIVTADLASKHEEAVKFLERALELTRENYLKTIVITHHAPSYLSKRTADYGFSRDIDDAYYSNRHKLIMDNPQIVVWVHGHTHDPCNYPISATRVISNPRGYPGQHTYKHFDPDAENFTINIAEKPQESD